VACLDNLLEVQASSIPDIGQGLFAKTAIPKGTMLLSTPVVAMHRDELDRTKDYHYPTTTTTTTDDQPKHQLLLNYAFGHKNSELLFVPYGPLAGYINHRTSSSDTNGAVKAGANVQIQWHEPNQQNDNLSRRQQHHHPELFELTASQVSTLHGKGLLIDFVATRDISQGEEVFLDYGNEWATAWKTHVENWKDHTTTTTSSAAEYERRHDTALIPTQAILESNPYPDNLETVCSYQPFWDLVEDPERGILQQHTWIDYENHQCLMPCIILDRYSEEIESEGEDDHWEVLYMAQLVEGQYDNMDIADECRLEAAYDYIVIDMQRSGIQLLDKPYTTDTFLPHAFRHEIGVPSEGFYPDPWLKKKVRRRSSGSSASLEEDEGEAFKKKEFKPTNALFQ
jgi:hypothetical protein